MTSPSASPPAVVHSHIESGREVAPLTTSVIGPAPTSSPATDGGTPVPVSRRPPVANSLSESIDLILQAARLLSKREEEERAAAGTPLKEGVGGMQHL